MLSPVSYGNITYQLPAEKKDIQTGAQTVHIHPIPRQQQQQQSAYIDQFELDCYNGRSRGAYKDRD